MQTENQYYAALERDMDANLVEVEVAADITIDDRVEIMNEQDAGALWDFIDCAAIELAMRTYFEVLASDGKHAVSIDEAKDSIADVMVRAAYDLTSYMHYAE